MQNSEKIQRIPLITSQSMLIPEGGIYRNGLKRIFDLLLALALLPAILPLLLVLIVLVKIDSRGASIYKSERVGRDGKKFFCLKLRTMCLDAEEKLQNLLKRNSEMRSEYEKYCKLKDDPRITKIGKFLRPSSLDELPQIFNVLKGEMSFVGPRPAFETEMSKYYKAKSKDYQKVRPGITGPWQTAGRNSTSFKTRVRLESEYVQNPSFLTDLKIILKTIPVALFKRGAY